MAGLSKYLEVVWVVLLSRTGRVCGDLCIRISGDAMGCVDGCSFTLLFVLRFAFDKHRNDEGVKKVPLPFYSFFRG